MTVVGIDAGGTRVKGALVSRSGELVRTHAVATPTDAGALTRAVIDLVGELRDEQTAAVGVASAGIVADGIVRYAANLPWRDEPVRDRIADASGLPTALGHDVAAAAVAESARVAERDVLFVALGTGIAAARVRDGVAETGATGRAGEIGHCPVRPDGEQCACGQRGCLEQYASAAAIARRYARRTGREVDTAEIARRVPNDADAAEVWSTAVETLAAALATCTLLLDPEVIVLGGGLADAGEPLLAPLRTGLAARLVWRAAPPLRAAVLGPAAGQLGAACLALQLTDRLTGKRQ
jgi:glucokinase